MKSDDAPSLEVLIDDEESCDGAEEVEEPLTNTAGAAERKAREETEQDVIGQVDEDMIRDLPPCAAQVPSHI